MHRAFIAERDTQAQAQTQTQTQTRLLFSEGGDRDTFIAVYIVFIAVLGGRPKMMNESNKNKMMNDDRRRTPGGEGGQRPERRLWETEMERRERERSLTYIFYWNSSLSYSVTRSYGDPSLLEKELIISKVGEGPSNTMSWSMPPTPLHSGMVQSGRVTPR